MWNRMVSPQCRLSPRIACLMAGQSAALSLSAVIRQRSADKAGPKIGPKKTWPMNPMKIMKDLVIRFMAPKV